MRRLPEQWLKWLNPAVGTFFDLEHQVTKLCIKAREKRSPDLQLRNERTIFDALTHSSVPPREQTLDRLQDESILVLFGGLDTTGRFLTVMLCYLITYPIVLAKIRMELHSLIKMSSEQFTWSQLEALPYLVKSDLRSPNPV